MIIDLLESYSPDELTRVIEIYERWFISTYHRTHDDKDLYDLYPLAPYWGDGACDTIGCCQKSLKYSSDGEPCDEYSDYRYNKWFNDIVTDSEREEISKMHQRIDRQTQLIEKEDGWVRWHGSTSIRFFDWLNKKGISRCIVNGIIGQDALFLKNFYKDSEYRLLFGTPFTGDITLAIDKLGWKYYSLYELTSLKLTKKLDEFYNWVHENKTGTVHTFGTKYSKVSTILFEKETDAMAVKLKWME